MLPNSKIMFKIRFVDNLLMVMVFLFFFGYFPRFYLNLICVVFVGVFLIVDLFSNIKKIYIIYGTTTKKNMRMICAPNNKKNYYQGFFNNLKVFK